MPENRCAKFTAQDVQAYRDDGYYFPLDVMSDSDAALHCERLDAFEAQHGPMHYRVKPYLIFKSAFEIASHPQLLDAVEAVIGPDILLWDCGYVIKEPHSESFFSWHQDLPYWGLEMASDFDLVSVWFALTPALQNNGSMRFVRGSHKQGTYAKVDTYDEQNLLHRGQTITEEFEESAIVPMELAPGQASLHQGWTVHASAANTSNVRRVGIVMNYVNPSVKQVVGDYETATLLRGEDNYGHFRPEPLCDEDFAPANVALQLEMERRKREVYDSA